MKKGCFLEAVGDATVPGKSLIVVPRQLKMAWYL